MIWPAMLFNLCVGLLFAAYLLRAVRRYERKADALIAKMDEEDAARQRRYDALREENRAAWRAAMDQLITEMKASTERALVAHNKTMASVNGFHHSDAGDADSSHWDKPASL